MIELELKLGTEKTKRTPQPKKKKKKTGVLLKNEDEIIISVYTNK